MHSEKSGLDCIGLDLLASAVEYRARKLFYIHYFYLFNLAHLLDITVLFMCANEREKVRETVCICVL